MVFHSGGTYPASAWLTPRKLPTDGHVSASVSPATSDYRQDKAPFGFGTLRMTKKPFATCRRSSHPSHGEADDCRARRRFRAPQAALADHSRQEAGAAEPRRSPSMCNPLASKYWQIARQKRRLATTGPKANRGGPMSLHRWKDALWRSKSGIPTPSISTSRTGLNAWATPSWKLALQTSTNSRLTRFRMHWRFACSRHQIVRLWLPHVGDHEGERTLDELEAQIRAARKEEEQSLLARLDAEEAERKREGGGPQALQRHRGLQDRSRRLYGKSRPKRTEGLAEHSWTCT